MGGKGIKNEEMKKKFCTRGKIAESTVGTKCAGNRSTGSTIDEAERRISLNPYQVNLLITKRERKRTRNLARDVAFVDYRGGKR